MQHSPLIDDIYAALRRCIVKSDGASPKALKALQAEHTALQELLTEKETELSVLNWLYDPDNVIDKPARKLKGI